MDAHVSKHGIKHTGKYINRKRGVSTSQLKEHYSQEATYVPGLRTEQLWKHFLPTE